MPHEPPPGPLARNLLALAAMIELRNDAEALAMLCKPAKTEPLPPSRWSRERRLLALLRAERRRSRRLLELLGE